RVNLEQHPNDHSMQRHLLHLSCSGFRGRADIESSPNGRSRMPCLHHAWYNNALASAWLPPQTNGQPLLHHLVPYLAWTCQESRSRRGDNVSYCEPPIEICSQSAA